LEFVVFGLNPFLHFLPQHCRWIGRAVLSILFESKYVLFVGAVQVIGGVLLLVNRYVPLALILLGRAVQHLCFHGLLSHAGWQPGVVTAILWIFLMFRYKKSFVGILKQSRQSEKHLAK